WMRAHGASVLRLPRSSRTRRASARGTFRTGSTDEARSFGIVQRLRPGPRGYIRRGMEAAAAQRTFPPGTERLTVAGHPAFFLADQPMARADAEAERRSRRGELPEITGYVNELVVWVEEADGQVTEITLLGDLDRE